jgi:branched-chain amino acid transport system ATP-binding protein
MRDPSPIVLNVSIEVIYNHVILVLKGVSFRCQGEAKIVAILGGNGAGKTTTLRAVSNLLQGERGSGNKENSIRVAGVASSSGALITCTIDGGQHCFAHLTIEEICCGVSYTPQGQSWSGEQLGKGLHLFSRLKTRRTSGSRVLHSRWRAADVPPLARHGQTDHGVAGRRPSMGL